MAKRITLISYISNNELIKVKNLMSNININTCKVPYGINDTNRYKIDNLPYHFTIFATNKENENKLLNITEKIKINSIKLKINDIKVMNSKNNSYVLYLGIEENEQIKKLQRIIYDEMNEESNYNPEKFTFHMTLHIDKDKELIQELLSNLKSEFKPFFIEFDQLALFNYPGDIIKVINIKE